MKILIVKTSSLGDILHTLPALTEAAHFHPNVQFDWVLEESFAEIPSWHPQVHRIIPLNWRRWRKNLKQAWTQHEFSTFYERLRENPYDLVIDAQGLLKSAVIARLAKGISCGLDFRSAREPLASILYHRRYPVSFNQHAIKRAKLLFSSVLNYPAPTDDSKPDYGIQHYFTPPEKPSSQKIIFIHGTTWLTKEWPESHWIALAKQCIDAGFSVQLPWGNPREKERAERIAQQSNKIEVLPRTSLTELAHILQQAQAAVAVDTGIGHLAAALNLPTLSLYGPTDPNLIGALGESQMHLSSPMGLEQLTSETVWEKLQSVLE